MEKKDHTDMPDEESLKTILPLVKKYGGGLVCLTLDDEGIPDSAQGRLAIARRIAAAAEAQGIRRRELLVDGLTMPVSAGGENANITLETIRLAKAELGVKTALGVSNVSFGLPRRDNLNQSFFTLALHNGLDGAIINPNSAPMMGTYRSYRALRGLDEKCQGGDEDLFVEDVSVGEHSEIYNVKNPAHPDEFLALKNLEIEKIMYIIEEYIIKMHN